MLLRFCTPSLRSKPIQHYHHLHHRHRH
uniref:Uncharacterized protein n=1 Tax=Anopheles albimanus TaxID=7167 RepID=A0A182FY99_ANOAL